MPLESLAVAIVFGAFSVARLAASWVLSAREAREASTRMASLRDAATEAGLQDVVRWGDSLLSGSAASFQVRLSQHEEAEGLGSTRPVLVLLFQSAAHETHRTRVDIASPRIAPGLWLRPEVSGAFPGQEDRKETEVGDDDFDRVVSVQGPPALALALLDAELRQSVAALTHGRLEVRGHRPLSASGQLVDSVLRLELSCDERQIPQAVRAGLDLATRLTQPEDLATSLAARLVAEPVARVRLKLLLTLLREYPGHAAARRAVVAAREDPDADVRLRAGIALGAEGRDVLLGVAASEGAKDATAAAAVAALADSLTSAQATDLLKKALRKQREATARACLKPLGRRGGSEAIHALTQVLTGESKLGYGPRLALAVDAAAALADTGDASVEPALLVALHSPATTVGIAAAQALGRVGTAAAVVPLREVEARDQELRSAARQAVAEIQARLGGAAPGQLSLAESESGRLSLAEGDSGRLSLADGRTEPMPEAEAEPPQRSAGRLKTTQ